MEFKVTTQYAQHLYSADNEDYNGFSQLCTFNSDNLGFTFTVPIIDDRSIEPTEQFIATVTTNTVQFPGVVLNPSQAAVSISDDDGMLHHLVPS